MAGYTIPYTPSTLSPAQASGKEGVTHAGGQTYPRRGLTDATAPTRTQFDIQQFKLLMDRVWQSCLQLLVEPIATPLKVGITAGAYRKADGTDVEYAGIAAYPSASTLTDATNNLKLWIDVATNAVTHGAAWPADKTSFVPLAELDTAGGAITEGTIRDRRTLVALAIPGTSSSPTGTTATAFTIDDDNAGAGASTQVRFNRGTDNAEDAALEWDEANDRVNVRAQHSTSTLAPLNASKLMVAGADVVDASGDLVAAAIAATTLYVFGANGASAYGARLTPAGSGGAPSAGTHAAGELHCDSAGVVWVCSAAGTPGTWVRVGNQGSLERQITIPDASGASPRTLSIQAKDAQGVNVSEVTYLQVGVYQDADGAANATNATIAVGGVGTLVRTVTAGKELIVKTNASGQVDVTITDGTLETIYVLAAATRRSRMLDCSDTGTVTIS